MSKALSNFLRAAAELLNKLSEFKFPNAVLRTVHQRVVYRLRQGDALSFQRPADHAMPNVMPSAVMPVGLTLGYHPISDVTEEVKDLVQVAIDHTTNICRSYGQGD